MDKSSSSRTLEEVLQSVSDTLFPEELGEAPVEMNSRGADGDTPLHVLIWRKDWEAARLLINAGADVNASGDMGETPLHLAVKQGDLPLVKRLLLAGADPDIPSEFDKTAREEAAGRGGPMENIFRRPQKKTGVNSRGT